jgi:hypothetical protein
MTSGAFHTIGRGDRPGNRALEHLQPPGLVH